ncbi:Elongation factor 1-delta [Saguinus oedipus]|uniref:Elongation factor 1-delta n=1 Tax=Saguinus oedipus TaxID=9490 RepID=A0ABQ9UH37_SAGOE|nr:Elongation factor 1-delta [Saguinus oedipus]
MATNFLVHEKTWFDKFKYDNAERNFYEETKGPVAGVSHQENGASVILCDIARARENTQKSLAGNLSPGASSGPNGDHSELLVRISSLKWRTIACAEQCRNCSRPSPSWRPS